MRLFRKRKRDPLKDPRANREYRKRSEREYDAAKSDALLKAVKPTEVKRVGAREIEEMDLSKDKLLCTLTNIPELDLTPVAVTYVDELPPLDRNFKIVQTGWVGTPDGRTRIKPPGSKP